ncbi:YppG family protein [Ornithinibacillus halophilus]|uniref:YppG-like protein n=1 Tax=Ornithinibacillus halophilus TaxID=930117 RepID=A0A1M5IVN6_9BACI|nr:YppG family protein [Ornithinibacillus halophilus]SHG32331.1 YppG-like protein [Ornithinibacillus halophilus]
MQYRPYSNYPPSNQGHSLYHQQLNQMHQPNFPYQQPPEQYFQQQSPFEQFQKPKQPADWFNSMAQNQAYQQYNHQQQPYSNYSQGILSQFQDENGQMNLDKMLSTVGQMANTYHQVQPIVKQVSSLLKNFRYN